METRYKLYRALSLHEEVQAVRSNESLFNCLSDGHVYPSLILRDNSANFAANDYHQWIPEVEKSQVVIKNRNAFNENQCIPAA